MVKLVNRAKDISQQLRWRLMLSYTVVTVGTLLIAVAISVLLLLKTIFIPNNILTPKMWFDAANENMVPSMRIFLTRTPPDTALIDLMLAESEATITERDLFRLGSLKFTARTTAHIDFLVFGQDGTVLGVSDRTFIPAATISEPLDPNRIPGVYGPEFKAALTEADGPLQLALAGNTDPNKLILDIEPNESVLLAIPVFAEAEQQGSVLGAVIANIASLPTESDISAHILRAVGRTALLFLLGAALLGAIFGTLTATGMVKRFNKLSKAAQSWSQGDFSKFITDDSKDELGQLSKQLNGMVRQLHELLQQKQELAVAEERNRLARELHDSAKQQAFAAAAQLGAAEALLDHQPQAARSHLQEAEKLIDSVRQELTGLILELRPVELDCCGLNATIQAYAVDWAHQSGITVDVNITGEFDLGLEMEKTLFRITQEALANVARHSQAQTARVDLAHTQGFIRLTVSDDGIGFDVDNGAVGFGLRTMKERAHQIGGSLLVSSQVGSGTRISVTCQQEAC